MPQTVKPRQLVEAETVATRAGRQVKWTTLKAVSGKDIPALAISHGKFSTIIRPEGTDICAVMAHFKLTDAERKTLAQLDEDLQARMIVRIQVGLLEQGHLGFITSPPTVKKASELEILQIERLVKLDSTDAGSVTDFLDAMQSVISAAVLAGTILGSASAEPPSTGTQTKPADVMFQ